MRHKNQQQLTGDQDRMKNKLMAAGLLLALGAVLGVNQMFAADTLPKDVKIKYIDGWRAMDSDSYKMNKVDKNTFLVEGLNSHPNHFVTLLQAVTPKAETRKFLLSADIRSENMDGWAGLWMRVDDANKKPLAFDNMADRSITGTQAWKPCKVVLDISPKAQKIVFGFLFTGKGKAWVKNIQFKPVDSQEKSTDSLNQPPQAQNLDQQPQNLEMK